MLTAPVQWFYLDLDGAQDVRFEGPVTVDGLHIPPLTFPPEADGQPGRPLDASFVDELVDQLNAEFAAPSFASDGTVVRFTAEPRPANAIGSTIYVGGSSQAFDAYGAFLGVAEKLDFGNQDPNDKAFVFADPIFAELENEGGFRLLLTETIVHEAGHLLGYPHAPDSTPTAPGILDAIAFTTFGGTWSQPGGLGNPVNVTYSYSNLLNGQLDLSAGFNEYELLQAVEEAFRVWSSVAPFRFTEVQDSGSPVNDISSHGGGQIRVGHEALDGTILGHAFSPGGSLGGDIHFDSSNRTWSENVFLETAVHEVGHALGLGHEDDVPAIMNSFVSGRYNGLGTAFLLEDDINGIVSRYGSGVGFAQNVRLWDGQGGDGDWNTHTNWSAGFAANDLNFRPTVLSSVQVSSGNNVSIRRDQGQVRELAVDGSGTQLQLESGGQLEVLGDFTLRQDLAVTGGQLQVGQNLIVGDGTAGSVALSAGTVTAQTIRMGTNGSSATFLQTGGSAEAGSLQLVGAPGEVIEYLLDGGTLRLQGSINDGAATSILRIAGGELDTTDLGNVTVDELLFRGQAGGQNLLWDIPTTIHAQQLSLADVAQRDATLQLRDGTLRVDGDIVEGDGQGRLLLEGGTLDARGTITVEELQLAVDSAGSDVTWSHANELTVRQQLQVGGAHHGTLTQSGGAVLAGQLQLGGDEAGKSAVYNLDAGTLSVLGAITDGGASHSLLRIRDGNLDTSQLGSVTIDELELVGSAGGTLLTWDIAPTLHVLDTLRLASEADTSATLQLTNGTLQAGGAIRDGEGTGLLRISGGTLDLSAGAVVELDTLQLDGGHLQEGGSIAARVLHDAGTFQPAAATAIDGDYQQAAAATLQMHISGRQPNQNTHLAVTGATTLAGTLELTLEPGLTLVAGDRFDLLDLANANGTFHTVSLPQLESSLSWDTSRLYVDGTVGVGSAPTDLELTNLTVSENSPGAEVGSLTVTDSDPGDTHQFSVSDSRFEVVSAVLRLVEQQSLDHETEPVVALTITATDSFGLSYAETVELTVTDLNDPPSAVQLDHPRVEENAVAAEVGNLSAVDQDEGDGHTFTVDDDRFEIAGATLRLKPDTSLDHEVSATIELVVTATDQSGASHDETLTLTVDDVNEAPLDIAATNLSVAENAEAAVIGTLTVSDPDQGDSHSFLLSDDRFEVVNSQLQLRSGISLNHEQEASIDLQITATDSGVLSVTRTLQVVVNDLNEPPASVQLSNDRVTENDPGAELGTLQVEDPDESDSHTFSVVDERFEIVAGTLRLKDQVSLDRESEVASHPNGTPVAVVVRDAAGLELESTFLVMVDNVNEPPGLSRPLLDRYLVAEQAFSFVVPGDAFSDPDEGDAVALYAAEQLDQSPLPEWLSLDPLSGTFSGTPESADIGVYQIRLIAFDQGDPALSDSGLFSVTVGTSSTPWQNPINPLDINGRDGVTPVDVLTLVNRINSQVGDPSLPPVPHVPPPYLDPSGDNLLTPADPLMVINFLNAAEGEGESGLPVDASWIALSAPRGTSSPQSIAQPAYQPLSESELEEILDLLARTQLALAPR